MAIINSIENTPHVLIDTIFDVLSDNNQQHKPIELTKYPMFFQYYKNKDNYNVIPSLETEVFLNCQNNYVIDREMVIFFYKYNRLERAEYFSIICPLFCIHSLQQREAFHKKSFYLNRQITWLAAWPNLSYIT